MSENKVRVYVASSLDGFIAGPDGDLSWLPGPSDSEPGQAETGAARGDGLSFEAFLGEVGAILMGRTTYDVVSGFGGPWPYGELPVLVATSRPLDGDHPASVRPVEGTIVELVASARHTAGAGDVYLDGGALIRQAADAGVLDEVIVTIVPIALGRGVPLFAGLQKRLALELVSHHRFAGRMLQVRMVPDRS